MGIELKECKQLANDPNAIDLSGIKVRKINKTSRGFFGTAFVNSPFDETYELFVDMYKKQGGEYRLLPYKVKKNLCET